MNLSQFHVMADSAPVLIWVADADKGCSYFNKPWLDFTGRALEQELGFGWTDAVHPDDYDRCLSIYDEAFDRRESFSMEYRLRHHDGSYRWVLDNGAPRYEPDGSFSGYIGSCFDITERKASEAALRDAEAFARSTVNALSAHIAILDETGTILAVNTSWRSVIDQNTGIASSIMEGANYLAFCDNAAGDYEADGRRFAEGIRRVMSGATDAYSLEYPYHSPTEHRWYKGTVTRFISSGRMRLVVAHENITERMEAEQNFRQVAEINETVYRVGQTLSAELDLRKLTQTVTDAATELTGAQFGAFFYNLVSEQGESYTLYTISGVPREAFEGYPMPRNTHVFGPTFRGEGIVRLDDVRKDPRYGQNPPYHGIPEGHLPVVSYLAVPVVLRTGDVLGGLFFGHPEPGVFSERHERIVAGLASQVAIALDNARLFAEAQEQRNRLAVTLASIGDAVIVTDVDGGVTFMNGVAEQLTGWIVDEAKGAPLRSVFNIIDEATRQPVEGPFAKVMRLGTTARLPSRTVLVRRDGREIPVDDSGAPIRDSTGTITGVVLVFRDVSGRRRYEDTMRFLADANAALTSSLDYQTTLQSISRLVVPRFADWCMIHMRQEDGEVRRVAITHDDGEKIPLMEAMFSGFAPAVAAQYGFRAVMRTGSPELIADISDDVLASVARDETHLEQMRALGLHSSLCVPIKAGDQPVGTITFISTASGRHYDTIDVALAEEVARRAAIAIENARLYATERHAREQAEQATARVSLLQSLTAALSEAYTMEQVARIMLVHAFPTLGVDAGTILGLSEDGLTLEVFDYYGYPAEIMPRFLHLSTADGNPMSETARTGQPIWIESRAEYVERFPQVATHKGRTTTTHALVTLPLQVEKRIMGGLCLAYFADRTFSPEARAFLLAIAQQCSEAVERARLFAAEANARREAERANAIKMTFLAMISHELRTPLTSIKGFASTLLADDVQFDRASQKSFLQIIDGEADKLTDLIEQLLDLSRLQTGSLGIHPERQDFGDIMALAASQLATVAQLHDLALDVPATLPPIMADPRRIAQVVVNLVGNASKYAPPGTRISVAARAQDESIRVDVTDEGPGIPLDAQAYVFEAFRQLEETRSTKGAGLGLAICRGLIEAHGGHIWIDNSVHTGTRISFTLPTLTELPA